MYRYLDARGMQKRLAHDNDLADAIRQGLVHARTPLGEGETGPWVMAEKHPAYQRLAKTVGVPAAKAASRAKRSRRPVVVATVVVALVVVGFMQVRGRKTRAELYADYQGALLGVQAGRMPPSDLLTGSPPDDGELEILWIDLRAAADVLAGADSAMMALGLDGFDPPATWLTAEYLSDAERHRDVGNHWARYVSFNSQYAARIPQLTRDGLHRYAAQANPSRYRASMLALAVDEKMEERMKPWRTRATIASAGHELHNALVNSSGRVVMTRTGGVEVDGYSMKMMFDAQIRRIRSAMQELDVFETPLRPEQRAILEAPAAVVRSGAGPRPIAEPDRNNYRAGEARRDVQRRVDESLRRNSAPRSVPARP